MGTGKFSHRDAGDGPAVEDALLTERDLFQVLGQAVVADVRFGEGYFSALAALGAQQMHPVFILPEEALTPEIFF
jgi:hypothetical protein